MQEAIKDRDEEELFANNRFSRTRINTGGCTIIDVVYISDSIPVEEALSSTELRYRLGTGESASEWILDNPTDEQLAAIRGLRQILET